MEYLRKFKYPLRSMLTDDAVDDEMLFIEHVAEQAIDTANRGHTITEDAYGVLDKAGLAMIRRASTGVVTEDQARIFDKILSAVQLNARYRNSGFESYITTGPLSGSSK